MIILTIFQSGQRSPPGQAPEQDNYQQEMPSNGSGAPKPCKKQNKPKKTNRVVQKPCKKQKKQKHKPTADYAPSGLAWVG